MPSSTHTKSARCSEDADSPKIYALLLSRESECGQGGREMACRCFFPMEAHHQAKRRRSCAGAAGGPGAVKRLQSLRRHIMQQAAEEARQIYGTGEWEP